MVNSKEHLNHLLEELSQQNNKNKKYMIQFEIANTTDETIKSVLQEMLIDLEKAEKRKKRLLFIGGLLVIMIVGMIIGIKKNESKKTMPSSNVAAIQTSQSTSEVDSTKIETTTESSMLDETNLTMDQMKRWVSAVWEKRFENFPDLQDYRLTIRSDEKDRLVYIDVLPPENKQVDKYCVFRVNENGQLEISGYYLGKGDVTGWEVISDKYMDTTNVEVKPKISKQTQQITTSEAETWVKDYLSSSATEPINFEDIGLQSETDNEGMIRVSLYTWNPAHTYKTLSSVFRVTKDGKLQQGSPYSEDEWRVVSDEFIR
ncbi:hypothetical protein [Vagococcus sp. CY52-2]|uniref:hypothetical protein n=1 Tax=Vagococcus sp. CY52-2 TaxID=2925838 RepID=UPI001F572A56|nr:hypothetical protein [Vagococcus sp. CY52-2]UNM88864.1 hypothetical protein MN187_06095 [Vagococcus sp. CY52-2]